MKNRLFFILIFCLMTSVDLKPVELFSVQEDNYTRFCNFTTRDGLSSNLVLSILQDKYGAIWFGTDNGLCYFDGSQFTTFRNNPKNPFSLSCNFVTSLVEDSNGNIWIGTRNGLNIYNRKNNHFTLFRLNNSNKQDLFQNHIKSLLSDKDDNVWIENALGYLYQINVKKNTTYYTQHSYALFEGDYYYHHIFQDSGNNLWISGRETLPIEVLKSNIHQVLDGKYKITFNGTSQEASCFTETLDGKILCGSNNGFVSFFNREKEKFEIKFSIPINPYAAITDNEGKVWFGGNGGLFRIDLNAKRMLSFKTNDLNPTSILSNKILSLYKDRGGNIWVGTENGVSLYSKRANVFRHYTTNSSLKNGLSSNRITALLQDKTGTLWIGTEDNGVDTFNLATEKFFNIQYKLLQPNLNKRTFEREKGILKNYYKHGIINNSNQVINPFSDYNTYMKSSALSFSNRNENNVSALYQDRNGIIYIGLWSHVGFNTYNKKNKTFKRYALFGKSDPNTNVLLLGSPWGSNWYSDFLEDSKGNLWCATWEGLGLNLFSRTKTEFSNKHFVPAYQPQFDCRNFYLDTKSERLYLCGQSYFGFYDLKKKQYHRYGSKLPKNYPFRTIFEAYYKYCKTEMVNLPVNTCNFGMLADCSGNLWLKTNHGLIIYNIKSNKFEPVDREVREGYANGSWVIDIALSTDKKKLWLASTKGIEKIDITTKTSTPFILSTTIKLQVKEITALYEDCKSRLWIGYGDQLLIINSKDGSSIKNSIQRFLLKEKLTKITKITENKNGNIWIGTQNGIFILNPKTETSFKVQYFGEKCGLQGSVQSICFDSQGKNWICSSDGLYELNLKSHKITTFKSNPNKQYQLINDYVYDVSEDTYGNLWISTKRGLCMLERKSGRIIDLSERGDDCLSTRLASKLLEDKDGNLWIGTTEEGVNVLHLQNEKITHFTFHNWDKSGISSNNIQCFLLDKNGSVWIGTDDGLNLYRKNNKTFEHFNTTTGLADNNIRSLQEDKAGKIWVSTNNGLSDFDPRTNRAHNFYAYHGLQENSFSGASCKLSDGRLVFGGNYGFSIFHPEDTKGFESVDPILFHRFEVRDSLRIFDLNPYNSINLNYSDNFFSIDFSAANFDSREGIRYRYKLNGFDRNWIYCNKTTRTAKYTNVPYGNYKFAVEASNPLGEWKGVERTMDIHILTPWYLQIWFILLLIILLISGIMAIIRYRERSLRAAKLRLEKIVDTRTTELRLTNWELTKSEEELKKMVAAKDKFLSIISHDLRNPFKALNMVSRSLYEQYSELSETEKINAIRAINDTAGQAGKLLENLLLWSLAQKIDIPYRPRNIDLNDLINACIELFELTAQKKNIQLINNISISYTIEADPNMMTTILGNLTGNAIKFSFQGSKIILSAKDTGDLIEISVSDTGTGMSMEDQIRLFRLDTKIKQNGTQNEQGTGLGLILCREFIEKQGGKIWVESEQGKGSTFIFTVLKATDHETN